MAHLSFADSDDLKGYWPVHTVYFKVKQIASPSLHTSENLRHYDRRILAGVVHENMYHVISCNKINLWRKENKK